MFFLDGECMLTYTAITVNRKNMKTRTKFPNLSKRQVIELISQYVQSSRPHQDLGLETRRLELTVRSLNLKRLP